MSPGCTRSSLTRRVRRAYARRPRVSYHAWARILNHPSSDDPDLDFEYDGSSTVGFAISPGKGCEAASVGFIHRRNVARDVNEWFWHTCCKTQYASLVSDEHLIKCHAMLVDLLDYAIGLGIDVVVRDETGYWESRNVAALLESVRRMNHIVASFAGALGDAISSASHQVESPIFAHPDFEHIEMEPDSACSPNVQDEQPKDTGR